MSSPADLYKDGLNRALFLPFIGMIKEQYGRGRGSTRAPISVSKNSAARRSILLPPTTAARAALDKAFLALTGVEKASRVRFSVLGREMAVPQAAGHVARFDYADLCKQPLGAADFLAIADDFHVLLSTIFPPSSPRNAMRRSGSST